MNLPPPPLLTMILRGFVGFNLFKLAKNLWWLSSSLSPSSSTAFTPLCFFSSVSSSPLFSLSSTAFNTNKLIVLRNIIHQKRRVIGREGETFTGSVAPIWQVWR